MRHLSLGKVLIGINVGLVLLAVFWVVSAAVGRLERLSDEQAFARVAQAGTSALQAIGRSGEEVATDARLLAERPTLLRLAETLDTAAMSSFLDRFRATTRLTGCAVLLEGTAIASSGDPPEPGPGKGPDPADCAAVVRRPRPGHLVLEAVCAAPSRPSMVVVTSLRLDESVAARIASQTGLPVALREREQALRDETDVGYDLWSRVLAGDAPPARRVDAAAAYLFAVPLRGPGGEIVGLVETRLPTTANVESLRGLVRSLVELSVVVIILVTGLSILAARWLVRPLETLTQASSRIGAGDLSTPIERTSGAEIGTLAASMDEMRGRLLQLTADLKRGHAEAEAVLTGIAEGVFAVDRERRIRYLNPQAAALLGVEPQDALGRFCGDILKPQGPGGVRPCETNCPIVHARFSGQTRATEHLELPQRGRRTVMITSATAGPVASGEEGGSRQFQVIRDETEAEAARRMRDVVLANISHEFRTPLTAQLASIELLRGKLMDLNAPEADMLVLSMQRGALRLTQLIDNLLESVRLETGKSSIRRRPVNLDEVIEEATELTAPLIAHRRQTLTIELPYPLPVLSGDAGRLTQVFVNLLANANKFAPEESVIRIGGQVEGDAMVVWIEDEGPGLRPANLATLFERFVRAPGQADSDEPDQQGMGLGLAIVKSIVDRHGGRVELRRAGTGGHRTRLCVILPLEAGHEDSRR